MANGWKLNLDHISGMKNEYKTFKKKNSVFNSLMEAYKSYCAVGMVYLLYILKSGMA